MKKDSDNKEKTQSEVVEHKPIKDNAKSESQNKEPTNPILDKLFVSRKYIFFILFALLLFLVFNILKPYFVIIMMSMILSYLVYPIFRILKKKMKSRSAAAGIVIVLSILIIFIPIGIISSLLYGEMVETIDFLKDSRDNIDQFLDCFSYENLDLSDNPVCESIKEFDESYEFFDLKAIVSSNIKFITDFFSNKVYSLIRGVTAGIIEFLMMIFIMFFLIRDGEAFIKKIKRVLFLKKTHEEKIIRSLNDTTYAILYGVLMVAIMQGIIAWGGARFIADINGSILVGFLIFFFALIPFIGSSVVYIPIAVFLVLKGVALADNIMIIRGIVFLIFGIVVISSIDSVLKPKIIGDRAKVHPLVIFLGIFGGLQFFGIFGIFIGPIVLSLLVTFIKLYEQEIIENR